MPQFPSVEWFDAVRHRFNADDSNLQAGGGSCNCHMGICVGDRVFTLTFEGLQCTSARKIDVEQLIDVDFYLVLSPHQWREMIDNIQTLGHADLHYTLNSLDLEAEDGIAQSEHNDQYREDLFFRYNQTLQFFFDASSAVPTTY